MHKKRAHKSSHKMHTTHNYTEKTLETKIVENLIALQRVHSNLAERFDKLSKEISQLLNLFETAAKSLASQPDLTIERDREFINKIDKLLEQNKTIAKSLMLMEERNKGKAPPSISPQSIIPQQMPRDNKSSEDFRRILPSRKKELEEEDEEWNKSIM